MLILYNRDEGSCSNPRDLYIMNADGSNRTLVYPNTGGDWDYQWHQTWGAKGRILFSNHDFINSNDFIGIINNDGSGMRSYKHPNHTSMRAAGWAFDDSKVTYYARTSTESYQLYMIDKGFNSTSLKLTDFGGNYAIQADYYQ